MHLFYPRLRPFSAAAFFYLRPSYVGKPCTSTSSDVEDDENPDEELRVQVIKEDVSKRRLTLNPMYLDALSLDNDHLTSWELEDESSKDESLKNLLPKHQPGRAEGPPIDLLGTLQSMAKQTRDPRLPKEAPADEQSTRLQRILNAYIRVNRFPYKPQPPEKVETRDFANMPPPLDVMDLDKVEDSRERMLDLIIELAPTVLRIYPSISTLALLCWCCIQRPSISNKIHTIFICPETEHTTGQHLSWTNDMSTDGLVDIFTEDTETTRNLINIIHLIRNSLGLLKDDHEPRGTTNLDRYFLPILQPRFSNRDLWTICFLSLVTDLKHLSIGHTSLYDPRKKRERDYPSFDFYKAVVKANYPTSKTFKNYLQHLSIVAYPDQKGGRMLERFFSFQMLSCIKITRVPDEELAPVAARIRSWLACGCLETRIRGEVVNVQVSRCLKKVVLCTADSNTEDLEETGCEDSGLIETKGTWEEVTSPNGCVIVFERSIHPS